MPLLHNDVEIALKHFEAENRLSRDTAIIVILRRYLNTEGFLPLQLDNLAPIEPTSLCTHIAPK